MTRKENNLKLCSDMTATNLEQFFAENVLEDLLCPGGTSWKSVAEPPLRKELLEADPCTRIASEIEVSISKPAQWLNTKTRGKIKLKVNRLQHQLIWKLERQVLEIKDKEWRVFS